MSKIEHRLKTGQRTSARGGAQSPSSSSPGTGGYTVEDLLDHLLNGGTGLP